MTVEISEEGLSVTCDAKVARRLRGHRHICSACRPCEHIIGTSVAMYYCVDAEDIVENWLEKQIGVDETNFDEVERIFSQVFPEADERPC